MKQFSQQSVVGLLWQIRIIIIIFAKNNNNLKKYIYIFIYNFKREFKPKIEPRPSFCSFAFFNLKLAFELSFCWDLLFPLGSARNICHGRVCLATPNLFFCFFFRFLLLKMRFGAQIGFALCMHRAYGCLPGLWVFIWVCHRQHSTASAALIVYTTTLNFANPTVFHKMDKYSYGQAYLGRHILLHRNVRYFVFVCQFKLQNNSHFHSQQQINKLCSMQLAVIANWIRWKTKSTVASRAHR